MLNNHGFIKSWSVSLNIPADTNIQGKALRYSILKINKLELHD